MSDNAREISEFVRICLSKPEATLANSNEGSCKMQDGIVGDHCYQSGLVSRLSEKIVNKIK